MILRSALALGLLATGVTGAAFAQGYPPYGQNTYQPPYRPLPGATVPDDDEDDIPSHQRAAPGNYPPPPGGYRGQFGGQQVDRGQLPPPGAYGQQPPAYGPPPAYQQSPAVVYGAPGDGRYPPPPPGRRGVGNGQPESYGAAPQQGYQQPYQQGYPQQQQYGAAPADQGQAPMQLGPVVRPQQDMGSNMGSTGSVRPNTVATLPPEDQPETGKFELPPQFKRQLVNYQSNEPAGTLVIDTANTHLYLVLGNGTAMRYGIGVGREGFTWSGAERVSRMAEWPDWHPPAEMIERQPYLPRFMAGGEGNPMGARALYLGKTLYRIHGTNQPSTIGKYVSSGCIRLTNEDIQDLYSRVQVGSRVVVLPGQPPAQASNAPMPGQQPVQQR